MFCPSCGTQVVEEKKFCIKCGTNLAVVSDALAGRSAPSEPSPLIKAVPQFHRELGKAVAKGVTGTGLLVTALIVFLTSQHPDALVFTVGLSIGGMVCLGKAISTYYEALAAVRQAELIAAQQRAARAMPSAATLTSLSPPVPTTSNLISPGSVVEHTTKHLEKS